MVRPRIFIQTSLRKNGPGSHRESRVRDACPRKIYLLRHHTDTPATTTTSARWNWLLARTQLGCARDMVMRRSCCDFGRIEIKSSSEERRFIGFRASSLLPLKLMTEVAAHD